MTYTLRALCCALLSLSLTPLSYAAKRTVKDKDLYRTSDILVSRGYHTVVPKKCVVFIPDNLKDKVVHTRPKGEFVMWSKFFSKNHYWLQKMNVNYQQAAGKEPLSGEKLARLKQTGKIIIAVHKNNPISVLKPENVTEP